MESYNFLLFLAIILLSTKFLGMVSRKVHMPQVVGALVAGIVLGPSFLGIISLEGTTGTFLECIAEVGVIFLMFFFINVFYINPIIDISKALKNYLAMRVPFDIDVAAKDEVFMLKEYIEQLILRIKSKKS